ncbi:MAG: DUF333 domain-containing protein [Deltaproteobacteria bacterium]|nr:DUF333 domain-containing protein [Deltaproteobacteria bacterium]
MMIRNQMLLCFCSAALLTSAELFAESPLLSGQNAGQSTGQKAEKKEGKSEKMSLNIPNPASRLCSDLGGKTEEYKNDSGSIALCHFSDETPGEEEQPERAGGRISEWTLFHHHNRWHFPKDDPGSEVPLAVQKFWGRDGKDDEEYDGHGHPALRLCQSLGGQREIIRDERGDSGLCVFSDKSSIDEWTLFRGPGHHPGLNRALCLKGG